jgi:hypothetical protein
LRPPDRRGLHPPGDFDLPESRRLQRAIPDQHVKVDGAVEVAADSVHERDGTEAGTRRCFWAALAERGLDRAQEDGQQSTNPDHS